MGKHTGRYDAERKYKCDNASQTLVANVFAAKREFFNRFNNENMNALLELRKQMEIDFLKTKTYEEINYMFNQMNDKLKLAESEVKKFRLGDVSKSFTAEQVVNELEDCDTLDDAIMFFKQQM